jgi:hypothetical protein
LNGRSFGSRGSQERKLKFIGSAFKSADESRLFQWVIVWDKSGSSVTPTHCQNMHLKMLPTCSCTVNDLGSRVRVCGRCSLSLRCVIGSILTTVVVLLSSGSTAHQPGDEFAEWFRTLKVPGNETFLNPADAFCCSPERDCQITDYETDATGLYWIEAEGERIQVPPEKILQHTDNPTGHAVACLRHFDGHPIVRCFVRPPES